MSDHGVAARRERWRRLAARRWISMQAMTEARHRDLIAALLPPDMASLSLLDLGCGSAAPTRRIACARQTFVDLARAPDAPEPFVEADALEYLRRDRTGHDAIFCLDMIEHLDHPVGEELLRLVTARARRVAVFFTPLGPMLLNPTHPAGHRSGWWPEDFERLGYRTWAFPRFHHPWVDGITWGAFYAWRWTRPEPATALRLVALTKELAPLHDARDLRDDLYLQGLEDRQARQWLTLRDAYRPALAARARPDVRTLAAVLRRAAASRVARLLPDRR
jgi:hypothetical protein